MNWKETWSWIEDKAIAIILLSVLGLATYGAYILWWK